MVLAISQIASYAPPSALPSVPALLAMSDDVQMHLDALDAAERAVEQARAALLRSAQIRHEALMRTRAYIVAAYGRRSHVLRTIGLKPLGDRKRRARRSTVHLIPPALDAPDA
ncbi:hypothetical protein F8S13_23325 [Chloroflexia bacterium SDU3-3]|nr:hypothetical protein F8S13_23325 [Chloroflexia bacterium SDU3-3]